MLDARIRLHWTQDSNLAVLSAENCDPVEALVESWPDEVTLSEMPLANEWKGTGLLGRRVTVDEFTERVRATRGHRESWTLSSTMTDLSVDANGLVAHAPFDPAGPGTIKWLHYRLSKIHRHVAEPTVERIRSSLAGDAPRVNDNGLGFDQTRLGSQSDKSDPWTDPIVEVMAFIGLALLPFRGRGSDARIQRARFGSERQRGWRKPTGSREDPQFYWPAWGQPLDADAIDALLDAWDPHRKSGWPLLGVHGGWHTVRFLPPEQSDRRRAFGAVRL